MKKTSIVLFFGILLSTCNMNEKNPSGPTAKDTALRLASSGTKAFEPAIQPVETEIAVFVNPTKIFQTFPGIGGVLTDASAEVFAKLSEKKQQELLKAYYDPQEGIGYTLARTTIHSCDFSSASYT